MKFIIIPKPDEDKKLVNKYFLESSSLIILKKSEKLISSLFILEVCKLLTPNIIIRAITENDDEKIKK